MAITTGYPLLNVEVLTNGIPLEEYNDEDERPGPGSVIKYIQSQSGDEFDIRCQLSSPWPDYSLMLEVYLDSKWVRGAYMMQKGCKEFTNVKIIDGQRYKKNGEWYLRRFCFSELQTGLSCLVRRLLGFILLIDESGATTPSERLTKDLMGIGEITVKAFRVNDIKQTHVVEHSGGLDTIGNVSENALKGRATSHKSK